MEVVIMFPRKIDGENPSNGELNTLYHHVEGPIMFPRQIGEENSSFEG